MEGIGWMVVELMKEELKYFRFLFLVRCGGGGGLRNGIIILRSGGSWGRT